MRLCIEIGGWDLLALPEGRVLGLEVGGSRLGERMVRRMSSCLWVVVVWYFVMASMSVCPVMCWFSRVSLWKKERRIDGYGEVGRTRRYTLP